ncbi:MAG: SIMPL domain-containing protein, partial [Janthinobacterium lividum]
RQELAAEAAKTAVAQARAIAEAVGEHAVGVARIEVSPDEPDRPRPMMAAAPMMKLARPSAPIAIEAGDAEISVRVNVTIRIDH